MTDMKIMETKPHTYEVTSSLGDKEISPDISIETDRGFGKWFIRICDLKDAGDEPNSVELTAAEAMAVAEFITSHVRKRW